MNEYKKLKARVEKLVFEKYGLKKLDKASWLSQCFKFLEEHQEYLHSETEEETFFEIGDMIFVNETLKILMNYDEDLANENNALVIGSKKYYKNITKMNADLVIKSNQIYIIQIYYKTRSSYKGLSVLDLLEKTIDKNEKRTGSIIGATFVKSEEL